MRNSVAYILLIAAVMLISACAPKYNARIVTISDEDAANITQRSLLKQPKFDLAKVAVARLTVDELKLEVTSLVPIFLRGDKPYARGFKIGNRQSFTVFIFDKERNNLICFTRDYVNSMAHKLVVPLDAIKGGASFSFPIARDGKRVETSKITFTDLDIR